MSEFMMNSTELSRAKIQVNEANKKIGVNFEGEKNQMSKDSFLKLLVTELRHQDPTRPMEDKEFVAQMAQFSSLEQITNLNKEIHSLIRSSESTQAFNMLGKVVDAIDPVTNTRISGPVSSVFYADEQIKLKIGANEISINAVHAVRNPAEKENN